MTKIKKILLPTDLSWQSRMMVDCLEDLLLLGVEEALVVYVLQPRSKLDGEEMAQLSQMAESLEASGISAHYQVIAGTRPGKDILDFARENSFDAIALASSGKGRATGLLLGSTSRSLMRHSPVPVLVKRFRREEESAAEACTVTFSNVLVVVDGDSHESQYADRVDSLIDRESMGQVNLFDVANGATWPWKEGYSLREVLSHRGSGGERTHGSLMRAVNSLEATAVILPRKGKGSTSWLLDRQRTEASIHGSRASMLVVPK